MAVAEKYPQYTNGIAVYSENEKNSYCYICPNKLPIASEEHLKNSDHLSTLAYYLHNFTENGPFVSCKLCSMWLEYSSIKEHAITHKLMPWYRPAEEFKIFYVNWISSKDNKYYCHLCDVKLSSWFHAIFHTEETMHRALRGDKINEAAIKELPFSRSYYKAIGHLASFMDTSESSICALCCVSSGTVYNQILKHSEGIIHIRNEEAFKEILKKAPVHVPLLAGSFDYDYFSQSKNAEGSTSENDFFSCSSEEDSKINSGPSEAQMVTSMAQMNLNSEKNEKASQDTEIYFSEGSCSSFSDELFESCSVSDGSVDYHDVSHGDDDSIDEFSVSESASTSQMPENASTSQIPEHMRIPEEQTASSLREVYNIEGTDIWLCLACNDEKIYTSHSMNNHLTSRKHSNRKVQKLFDVPKQLNNTNFVISSKFRSEGIVGVPTKTFAVCTLCKCKLYSESEADAHLSSVEYHTPCFFSENDLHDFHLDLYESCHRKTLGRSKPTQDIQIVNSEYKENERALLGASSAKTLNKPFVESPRGIPPLIPNFQLPESDRSLEEAPSSSSELSNQDNQIFHCEHCRLDVIGKKSWKLHTLFAELCSGKRNERTLLEAASAEVSDKVFVESPRRIQPMISNFQLAESDNSLKEEETFGSSKPGGVKIPQKYYPMVDCNICNCKIPGGDANISNHRSSQEHIDNEAKLFAKPTTPADTGNSLGNISANSQSFNAQIPFNVYSQYYYLNGMTINYIECKLCNIIIYGIGVILTHYNYAFHTLSELHKIKEMEFAEKWRASAEPSKNGSMARFNEFDGEKAMCLICQEVLKSKKQLHSHMTSHFWMRFTKNPPLIIEKAPDKHVGSEPLKCMEESDHESAMNESPMKTVKRTRFRSKSLDIEITDSTNIYEIDKQRMSEIKAGVLFSLPKDKDSIYCLICRCNVSNNLQTFYEHLCSVKHLDFLKGMLEDDQLFQNCENQLSDLALGYEYMEDISETAVKCHACDISVNNKFSKLHKHINSASHIDKWTAIDENSRELFRGLKSKMECNFYSVRWYWCVICNLKFITECEFQKHLKQRKHLKETRKIGDEFLMFDYCGVCASLWYGFLKTFSYHSDCKMHKYNKLDGFFSINKLPESAERLLNSPEERVEAILRGLEFRRAIDKSKEDQLLRDLREIAVVIYPNAVAHPFGSRMTRLGGKDSDLDVFLDCPTQKSCMYFGENSQPELIERRLVKIKESLENNTNIWHIDREILDCRIPIIKIKHKPTDIECDLSFTNGLTVENTALIRNYCDKSADCRKLIIFIKNWMNHCELSGANGINSYGIAWLVIYFLQTKKILPTVNQLIEMNNKSQIIAGWETGVSKDFQVQTFGGSFGELLNEFFKFYGNFDYRHDVICPLLGEIVKKIDFQHRGKLPSTMGPYSNYLHATCDAEPFRVDSIMCLQDPFDLAHNITKAVKKFTIYKFRNFCYYSTKLIDNNV